MSNLIATPSSDLCKRKNSKLELVNVVCHDVHFYYWMPLNKISHSLYNILTWIAFFFVTFYHSLSLGINFLTKIMLPMFKLYTNYDFHELFLKHKQSMNIWHFVASYTLQAFRWSFYFCLCLRDPDSWLVFIINL